MLLRIDYFGSLFYNQPMKIIEKNIAVKTPYPLRKLGDPKKLLFFDIETTGLSASNSALYLIGTLCLQQENGERGLPVWTLRQFFAEEGSEELSILKEFLSYARSFDLLLSFNGEGFDLPFLRKISAQYRIPFLSEETLSLDIYKSVRKYRSCIESPRMNQKSLEAFLGIKRRDPYSGKELIELYEKYAEQRRNGTGETAEDKDSRLCPDSLLQAMLLHNEEDLSSLPLLLSLLFFKDFFLSRFRFCGARQEEGRVSLLYRAQCALPREFTLKKDVFLLRSEKDSLIWESPLYRGEAKHYFADYKNYYYLPAEDYAIHKSIGIFVDPAHRVRAKKENAYIKKSSLYLPLPREQGDREQRDDTPDLFYRENPQGRPHVELQGFLSSSDAFQQRCLGALLKELL